MLIILVLMIIFIVKSILDYSGNRACRGNICGEGVHRRVAQAGGGRVRRKQN